MTAKSAPIRREIRADRARKRRATNDSPIGSLEDRRSLILRKATVRIAKFGFDATTVRQLADDVNILSGSLYHHFATKDEILYDIVKDAVALLRDETLRIVASPADPEIKLVALVMRQLGEFVQNHAVHAILYNERKILRSREEFADIRQAKQDAYRGWRKMLEAGMDAGLFDRELDLYQTIRTITRMLNSAADWFASHDETVSSVVDQYTFEQVETFYLRFIVGAIRHPVRAAEPLPIEAGRQLALAQDA
jgi:AcrR family transcriptional regulator